ncbi:TIGR02680 family protein [Streptomyces sp. bgisy100]|uniref:TIGR02680 family protein n=1 Tax=Streptomyces sp. bgisy100 TaxID=3413783 RepID=UPI003D72184E
MSITELPRPAAEPADGTAPGAPAGSRWQPSRAGIVNVWRYYDETFTFHDGRLLLRGPNGSGKSKALEVLLPHLFDASLRPHRLSTFGGSERTMHWNLMGSGTTGKTRVGYVWLEFTRGRGEERSWFCCGARLQASAHTSAVHADYFTTTQRIAVDGGLPLVNAAGQPLTRAALAEALAGHGEVHASPEGYRDAVRGTLFPRLSEQRYEALITALLQLRTPKLSERLDPSLLSSLLSKALPPLGTAEVAELADGFEQLDQEREQLRRLDEEVAAAGTLAARQRDYARRVLRGAASGLISAGTELETLALVARQSEESHDRARAERDAAEQRRKELTEAVEQLEAGIDGLTDSAEYRRGGEADQLRRQTEEARADAVWQRREADAGLGESGGDERLAEETQRSAASRAAEVAAALDAVREAARSAGLEPLCPALEAALEAPGSPAAPEAGASDGAPAEPGGSAGSVPEGASAVPGSAAEGAAGLSGAVPEGAAALPGSAPEGEVPDGSAGSAEERARTARRLLRDAVRERSARIAAVRRAVDRLDRAVTERGAAEEELEGARERLAEAHGEREECDRVYDRALGEQAQQVREWAEGCAELRFADLDDLVAHAATESAVSAGTEEATRTVEAELTASETVARAALRDARQERGRLTAGVELLGRQTDLPPTAPATRTAVRSTMDGAPLWRLVAFHDEVPDGVRAGVEAALQACGLLDAWVGTHGEVTAPGHDVLAHPESVTPVDGPSLLDVLRPEPGTAVPTERVRQLLAAIAHGPALPAGHPLAVGADGSWRLAGMTGTWSKEEAAHIGASARERTRRRRIAELLERLDTVTALIGELDEELQQLQQRRERLAADRRARPNPRRLRAAKRRWDRAESLLSSRDDAVRAAVTRLEAREQEVARALRALGSAAEPYGLPAEHGALDTLESAVAALQESGDRWLDAQLRLRDGLRAATDARDRAGRSRARAGEHLARAEAAESRARSLAATLEAAESAAGESHGRVAARIGESREALAAARRETEELSAHLVNLAERIGALGVTTAEDIGRRDAAVAVRDGAAEHFRQLCLLGFAEDADIPLACAADDGIPALLSAAQDTAEAWPSLAHGPEETTEELGRLTEALHTCRPSLGARAELGLETHGATAVLTASLDGTPIGAARLHAALIAEREQRREHIGTAERTLFETALEGDVRRHLAARIRQANELVDTMNAHLGRVRTASDVAVRLVWQVHPDLPPDIRTARDLLLADPATIGETGRATLHAFLRSRIEEAKARNTAATWEEQLSEVLNYPAWHQFVVELDRSNGSGRQLLTKKLHGALSGGEKAIALHLPLFAAVAAHYQAVPEAPRLILLDEVFAGVDTANRGQVFGLLGALDLDLVLTSDHEWCTYRELDGIAVHQLITGDGDDAVTSARFVWSGGDLRPEDPADG